MHIFSNLTRPSIAFLGSITSAAASRSKAWSIAVAYAIARTLALPVEQVEDIMVYYRLNMAIDVQWLLSDLNEAAAMNTDEAKVLIEAFYQQRYSMVNPPAVPLALRKDKGIEDFFGLTRVIPDDVLCEINCNPDKITTYVNGLTKVLADLQAAKKQRYTESSATDLAPSYAA